MTRSSSQRSIVNSKSATAVLTAILATIVLSGCNRAFFREQADQDVAALIAEKAEDLEVQVKNIDVEKFNITPHSESRMFDVHDPDYPPMPPDDPTSHRLMHRVYNMEGYSGWGGNGHVDKVDDGAWRKHLPLDEDGVIQLDFKTALDLAFKHSPGYQSQMETLYLAALDLHTERFNFDTQFYGGYSTHFAANGGGEFGSPTSVFDLTTRNMTMRKQLASGGNLAVNFFNSLVWQFSGDNTYGANTLLSASLLQPLMRRAGRDRVLELITIAERNMLANMRQMELYQTGFVMDLLTGDGQQSGFVRRGGFFGASGLGGFTGVGGGGFGAVGRSNFGSGGGGVGTTPGTVGGYLGILQAQKNLQTRRNTVQSTRNSLIQFNAFFDANRIDFFQVEQMRSSLVTQIAGLLGEEAGYQRRVDGYKFELGLPQDVELNIVGDQLERFNLIDPQVQAHQDLLTNIQERLGILINSIVPTADATELAWSPELADALGELQQLVDETLIVQREVRTGDTEMARVSISELVDAIPHRKDGTKLLKRVLTDKPITQEFSLSGDDFDDSYLDGVPAVLNNTLDGVETQLDARGEGIRRVSGVLAEFLKTAEALDDETRLEQVRSLVFIPIASELTELSANTMDLSLVQAEARSESVVLTPVTIKAQEAFQIALNLRPDFKNRRAGLVDSWRLVQYNADDLESTLDVRFDGDIRNVDDNPVKLDDVTGSLRVGLEWDAPITKLRERNKYRQALIEYQQARRQYYGFEDGLLNMMRHREREVLVSMVSFELIRKNYKSSIRRVQSASFELQKPPEPMGASTLGPTTAQNLISSYNSLQDMQNSLLSQWVNYEIQRSMTDLLLGSMKLDDDYNWIDPGPIGREFDYPSGEYSGESSDEADEGQSQAQSNTEEEEKSDSTSEKVG
ncbi:MAG: hypothetical protein ACJZ8O_11455 [Pirellulaceae bacterium]